MNNFARSDNGLVPVKAEVWEAFVFVDLDPNARPLKEFLGGLVINAANLWAFEAPLLCNQVVGHRL